MPEELVGTSLQPTYIQIAKKHNHEQGMTHVQSYIKSQNALLPFQGSWGMASLLSTMNGRVEVMLII